jgi:hypothetical protein
VTGYQRDDQGPFIPIRRRNFSLPVTSRLALGPTWAVSPGAEPPECDRHDVMNVWNSPSSRSLHGVTLMHRASLCAEWCIRNASFTKPSPVRG